jgi:hypothetical protein
MSRLIADGEIADLREHGAEAFVRVGCAMKDTIDVFGATGAAYRFNRVRDDRPLSPMGGNFIYARDADNGCEILFLGEAQNLMTDARRLWDTAVRDHGAQHLFTRLNVTERVRRQEQSDILAALTPSMNKDSASTTTRP